MKLFELRRDVDETGISGTGTVAQGAIFDNGWCALTWLTDKPSMALYRTLEELISIHSHGGKTRVVQVVNYDGEKVLQLVTNWYQDHCENVGVDFMKGNHKYMWDQREELIEAFKTVELPYESIEVEGDDT